MCLDVEVGGRVRAFVGVCRLLFVSGWVRACWVITGGDFICIIYEKGSIEF